MSDEPRASFTPEDVGLLQDLREGNAWLRAVIATVARRGVAFRRADGARAQAWLDALATYPYYKAGQFVFDLLEWEDFILDEPAPTLVSTLDPQALRRLASLLNAVKAHLDGAVVPQTVSGQENIVVTLGREELPPIEAGFYLYQDVVLGVVSAVLSLRRAAGPGK